MYRLIKTCQLCGEEIGLFRLMALPKTRRCIRCSAYRGTDMKKPIVNSGMDGETYLDLIGAVRS